ncbi:MAG: trehalose-phosphatase [Caulobacteraceae bacterium]
MTVAALCTLPDIALPAPRVPRLAEIALFADLDGTLAPIEATPDAVKPDASRRRLLDALAGALEDRLAVISGRALSDLDRLLEGRVPALAAVHGLVRRTAAGQVIATAADVRVAEALSEFRGLAKSDPRLLVEDKAAAVALHFRAAPEAASVCRDLARRLAARLGLIVQEGNMVVELRAAGPDKGDAVASFMREPPFAGFIPVFIGDDLTDEHGFEAARALGGFGVIVGARRPTAALYALADVAAAQAWLNQALEAG